MNKVFITASFQNSENKEEIEKLCKLVKDAGFEDFCFIRDVEHYQKVFDSPKDLMERSKVEIAKCEYLLIDLTDKPTGRAYEAGIAYAMEKKIITILKKDTKIKDTTRGISSYVIEYEKIDDIVEPLSKILHK